MNKKIYFLFLALILAVGIYARFADLGWHFTNVDDRGVAEVILENNHTNEYGFFPIPRYYTYAPFQYFITPFLISEEIQPDSDGKN